MPPQNPRAIRHKIWWISCENSSLGASLPLPPTHKSEHLTQHVEDSCFQQPFPPFVSLSKVPKILRIFTLFEKLNMYPVFVLPKNPCKTFLDFRRFLTHKARYGAGSFSLYPQGEVFRSQRFVHRFTCPMVFTRLPFDEQVCTIKRLTPF